MSIEVDKKTGKAYCKKCGYLVNMRSIKSLRSHCRQVGHLKVVCERLDIQYEVGLAHECFDCGARIGEPCNRRVISGAFCRSRLLAGLADFRQTDGHPEVWIS